MSEGDIELPVGCCLRPAEKWSDKAKANLEKWGQQDVDTLLLAMQEELGELTQAHLEARAEGGDASRVGEELADLAALCYQLEWLLNTRYQNDLFAGGGRETAGKTGTDIDHPGGES